jgi:hypothetical protein
MELIGPDSKVVRLDLASGTTSSTTQPGSGKYSAVLPAAAVGEHTLRLSAQGKTFKREKTFPFKVVEPITVSHVDRPIMPRQAPPSAPDQKAVSWTSVLIQFLIINIVIAALTATVYFIRKGLLRRGQHHDNN